MKDDSIVDIERKAIAYLDKIRQEEGITEQTQENLCGFVWGIFVQCVML